jgi:hypothetical protein
MPPVFLARAGIAWRKAQRSAGNGACVEVASHSGMIAVRDSKDPNGPVLTYAIAEWRGFLDGAKNGAFNAV